MVCNWWSHLQEWQILALAAYLYTFPDSLQTNKNEIWFVLPSTISYCQYFYFILLFRKTRFRLCKLKHMSRTARVLNKISKGDKECCFGANLYFIIYILKFIFLFNNCFVVIEVFRSDVYLKPVRFQSINWPLCFVIVLLFNMQTLVCFH